MPGRKHKVQPGEGIGKIARRYGYGSWTSIWNDPANKSLKDRRSNPNVLHPGDVLIIPDKETKQLPGGTEQRHRFACRLPKLTEHLRVQIEDRDGKAMANKDYAITLDTGDELTGTTDGDGYLEEQMPIESSTAALTIDGCEWQLDINELNPVDEETSDANISGAQARLSNLGYPCPENGQLDDATQHAIKAYQADIGLSETGQLDEATRSSLRRNHGA